MPYKALVFDYDGTIVDTERAVFISWQELFREHGLELPLADWDDAVGAAADAVDPYAMLAQRLGQPVDRLALEVRRRAHEKKLLGNEPLRPGVAALIQDAKAQGLLLGMASNSSYRWIEEGLAPYGLLEQFDTVCTPDDGVPPKPDPALYRLAVERLGVAPSEAVAIEDSPHGAAAARAAGLACVVVPSALTKGRAFPEGCIVIDTLEGMSARRLIAAVSGHLKEDLS
ncbi:MAG: HAD family phosphatase [Clostridia bacterium]